MISRIAILSRRIDIAFSVTCGDLLLEIPLVGFSPVSSAAAHRSLAAGISCTNGCVRGPGRAPHWSCENCGAGFPRSKLRVRTPPIALPASRPRRHLKSAPTCQSCDLPSLARPDEHPPRSPHLRLTAEPVVPPRCGVRAHSPATNSAAAPQSPHRRRSFLSNYSAPPLGGQNAPPAKENPQLDRVAAAGAGGTHKCDETGRGERRFALPGLPGCGGWPPPRARSRGWFCLRPHAQLRLLPERATISPAWPPAYRRFHQEKAFRLRLARTFPGVWPP